MFCYAVLCDLRGGAGNASDSSVATERVQEQKEKMQTELHALWINQHEQIKKKKEQFATEVGRRADRLMEEKKDVLWICCI